MKLIIDIPEWKYKSICEGVEASKRCGVVGIDPDIHEAIYNGTPQNECENCDFRKFSEKFVDGFVDGFNDLMNKNGITSVEQLSEILKRRC